MNDQVSAAMALWFDSCHRANVGLGAAAAMGEELVAAYGEPHRHYHTLEHINTCLQLASEAPLEPADQLVVEFALWFHDVVYEPHRDDNEAMSARQAEAWMQEVGAEGAGRVIELIEMTAGHELGEQSGPATKVVHDIDLAILGSTPDEYSRYVAAIRAEYGWLSDDEFASGRTQVLQGFSARDRIYALPGYVAALEQRARNNIAAELTRY